MKRDFAGFDVVEEPEPCTGCDGDGWVKCGCAPRPCECGFEGRRDCERCAGTGEEPEKRKKR